MPLLPIDVLYGMVHHLATSSILLLSNYDTCTVQYRWIDMYIEIQLRYNHGQRYTRIGTYYVYLTNNLLNKNLLFSV